MKQLISLTFIFFAYTYAKAQYTNENYSFTYKIKLQGVYSPGEAKNVKNSLVGLFDSRHQSYNIADSSITIRSALNLTEATVNEKIGSQGYILLFFHKKQDVIIREEEGQK